MTLREFIEQEIELGTISCFEDFRSSLQDLTFYDGEELDLDKYEDYLDCYIEWAEIKINHNRYSGTVWYEIELVNEE
jgi:hypothetical protein